MPPYKVTSPASREYNCVAWAVEENTRWWWPDANDIYFWPQNAPRAETLDAFESAFGLLGYERCESTQLEDGWEKIAVFVGSNAKPTHVARQLNNSQWTSKLGSNVDIEHELTELQSLIPNYGSVALVLKRPFQQ